MYKRLLLPTRPRKDAINWLARHTDDPAGVVTSYLVSIDNTAAMFTENW